MLPLITSESFSQPTIRSEEIAPAMRIEASGAIASRRSIGTRAAAAFFPSTPYWPSATPGRTVTRVSD
jgi:hypothetical protein